MASYDALINLKLKGLKDLKKVENIVDKINKPVRTANTRSRVEEKLAKSTEARRVAMIETRRVGDLIQKGVDKGLKLSKARNAVDKSALANQKGEFKVSKAQLKVALDELNVQTKITEQLGKQNAARAKSMLGGPSVSSGIASSRFGSTRQPGSPRFIASRAGMMQGPAAPPYAPGMYGSSPIGGSKFMFGSPAQVAFSGSGMGRSPILGSKDLVGSPKYYEAVNKDIKRIASQNVMPVEGFKHIPGSPAYLKDQAEQLNKLTTPKGDFSSLSDRQSRNVKGKRTFMNNRFARMGLPMPTKGFDAQSALISGAFPLLFGQGPVGAAAGALGGGIGGMFGQMGGFAGGIAATALVQQVQQLIGSLGNLGKAMGPFVQDTNALIDSMGLAGTAEAKRIQIIEQLQGKQAAFNAAMQMMNETIGTEATKRLKDFGEKASLVGSEFKIAMTRMQASLIRVINLVDRLFGISANAQRLQRERTIKNSKDVNIRSRVDEIEELRGQTGGGRQEVKRRNDRIKLLERELKLRADVEIIETNIQTKADELTLEFAQHVKKIQEKADLEKEVAKLMAGGMKQSVAEQIAQNNILADQARKRLQIELEIIKARINDPTLTKDQLSAAVVEFNRIKQILLDIGVEQDKINKLTEEYGKKTEKVKVTKEQIADVLANQVTDAIMGLIEGTKTLGEALAGIAKQLASMFLNAAFKNIFSGIGLFSEQGSYSRAGGFKAFQYGGVVNSPTLGMIGEGGESEYVIPASKMDGAMSRYSAGARGGAVIPGGSHESGTVAGGTGNAIVEYTGPVLNFNGDEYVPKSAVPEIIGAAAKRGAMAGKAQVIGTLKNSRGQRASLGL